MAYYLNVDVKTIVERKLKETEKKYPIDKCKGKSLKYTAYIENKNK